MNHPAENSRHPAVNVARAIGCGLIIFALTMAAAAVYAVCVVYLLAGGQ